MSSQGESKYIGHCEVVSLKNLPTVGGMPSPFGKIFPPLVACHFHSEKVPRSVAVPHFQLEKPSCRWRHVIPIRKIHTLVHVLQVLGRKNAWLSHTIGRRFAESDTRKILSDTSYGKAITFVIRIYTHCHVRIFPVSVLGSKPELCAPF
jgi:hypothetical protein